MTGNDMRQYVGGTRGLLCLLAAFSYWQNYGMKVKRYVVSSPRLPSVFDGFKVIQVSDYHNTKLLHNKVIKAATMAAPDIIVVTGDLFDCRRPDKRRGLSLLENLVKIAPVFYVSGNHESKLSDLADIRSQAEKLGVTLADNRKFTIERPGGYITLVGMADPQFYLEEGERGSRPNRNPQDKKTRKVRGLFREDLFRLCKADNSFKLLISHRPEFIHTYSDAGIDLALTGHAHGGQFGIPFTDIGVFVPNQGLFPPYAAGMKKEKDTVEIISRGLGNSGFPQRLFNRPQLVQVELENKA